MLRNLYLKNWLTTTNHKKIGILYIITAVAFLIIAGLLGMLMRTQLATPNENFLNPFTYDEVVTLHGLLMILWVLSPLAVGLANYIVPLQIGAKDLAFPRLNATSYWTYLFSGVLLAGSIFLPGGTANTGWTLYAPLATSEFTPQAGATLAVLGLALLGISVTLSSINFITTIVKNRAKGVTWKRLPLFTWSVLMTMALMLFAFPPLVAGLALLTTDRVLGTVFFSSMQGGSILWDQLFWFFAHPEVYIVVLPAIGIIAEVFVTFAKRPMFAKKVFIVELGAVTVLSIGVWMHHMFTTGINFDVLQTFAFTTMAISIPFEGVVIGLVLTLRKGNIKLSAPLLFCMAAIFTVTLGGITGVLQAFPVLDYAFRGTYWIVGHFHYVMAGTTLFALIGGIYYWWPKITKRQFNQKLAVFTFFFSFLGFNLLYFPYFFLMDMPRRISTYAADPSWGGLNFAATIGAFVFGPAVLLTVINLIISYRKNVPSGLNPWDSKELEWTGDYTGTAAASLVPPIASVAENAAVKTAPLATSENLTSVKEVHT
jgi:cytochrome c oxidase subunit I+III